MIKIGVDGACWYRSGRLAVHRRRGRPGDPRRGHRRGHWPFRSRFSRRSFCSSFAIPIVTTPPGLDSVMSPADGRVLVAGDAVPEAAPPAPGSRSAFFCRRWMSTSTAFRRRVGSRKCRYTPGKFLAGVPPRCGHDERAQRNLDRSRRPDGRVASDRRLSGATRRVSRRSRHRGARRRSVRRHEIWLANGRVSADERRDPRAGGRHGAGRGNGHRGATLTSGVRPWQTWTSRSCEGNLKTKRFDFLCSPKRDSRRRRHPLRLRRGVSLLPSLFTMGNMFCGYACIVYAMRGDFETAAPFIGIAVVLDMLDGRIARLTGTASDFGVELDSLADVISFGVAPAILVVCVGPSAAWPSRVRGRVSLRQRRGASAGAVQHPERRGHRQALLRRDAESARGRHRGVNGLRLPVRLARLSSRAAGSRDGA